MQKQKDAEYIYRDVFLWCILTHRLEMANIFLGQIKTRICSALIASKILKSFAQHALDHQSKHTLNNEADEFEMCAIECVPCAYFYDTEQTCELIIRRLDVYVNVTCLQMAIAADIYYFMLGSFDNEVESFEGKICIDQLGTVYVADTSNHRIMRCPKGATQGSVIAGGNGAGRQSNQLTSPVGLSFDRHGNLYVVDYENDRVQKFNIEQTAN
ncbi:unnamed protein product [Rotaria sordida]|nr:unnamed protein product [Rotaria sordida]